MGTTRRQLIKGMALGAAALALPAAGRALAADAQAVRYGGSAWLGHYPAWLAIKAGYFKEQGLEVGWESFGTTSARVSALLSGNIDMAVTAAPAALAVMSRGSRHFAIIGVPENFGRVEGLIVRKGVQQMADLKGKKIGVTFASSAHLLVLNLLDQAGLQPDRDVTVLNVPAPEMPAAFQSGQIDAAAAWTPQFNAIKAMPGVKVLADDTGFALYKAYGVTPGPDVLVARRAFLKEHPEAVRRFLKAYFRANEQLKSQPDSAVPALVELTKLTPAEQLEMVKGADWYSAAEQSQLLGAGSKYIDGLQKLAEMMVQYGQIDKAPPVREWIDPAYL
ncbi:ABC transporter substrate-binding protein [Bordetella petrii]|uniref:ABC transporter substrate-binding protein n=1 Tax=Bordetella petrii TaxID=94624 RepID=UPI00048FA346|nr:ABC transporter substrate-binding protein [Bordetella petrii]